MGCIIDRTIKPMECYAPCRTKKLAVCTRRVNKVSVQLASPSTLKLLEEINELQSGTYDVIHPEHIGEIDGINSEQIKDELEYPCRIRYVVVKPVVTESQSK